MAQQSGKGYREGKLNAITVRPPHDRPEDLPQAVHCANAGLIAADQAKDLIVDEGLDLARVGFFDQLTMLP